MDENTSALAVGPSRAFIMRTTGANVAVGAAAGTAGGVALAMLSTNVMVTFPVVGVIAIGMGVAFIAFLIALFASSRGIRHSQAEHTLERIADLYQRELINRSEYETLKARTLANLTHPETTPLQSALHVAKLAAAGSIGLGSALMAISINLATVTGGAVGLGLGAIIALVLSLTYHVVLVRLIEEEGPAQLHSPQQFKQLDHGETTYEPLG